VRLIDADALDLDREVEMADDWNTAHEIANCVKYAPTIDAVPVVRCRECRYWVGDFPGATEHVKRCELAGYMVGENGYCVYGERREDSNETD